MANDDSGADLAVGHQAPGQECPAPKGVSGALQEGKALFSKEERAAIIQLVMGVVGAAGGRAVKLAVAALKFAAMLLLGAGVVAGYADGDDLDEVGCTVAQQTDAAPHDVRSAQAEKDGTGKRPRREGPGGRPPGGRPPGGRPPGGRPAGGGGRERGITGRRDYGITAPRDWRAAEAPVVCKNLERCFLRLRDGGVGLCDERGEVCRVALAAGQSFRTGTNWDGRQGGTRSPEYLIKQEGTRRRAGKQDRTQVSTWRIWFRGHDVLMPAWVGTECLIFLMRSQGGDFDADVLTRAIRKSTAAGAGGNKETAREILHGPEGYSEDGEAAGGRIGDLNERDVIWDDRQIADCLRKIKAFDGEVRLHEKAGDFSSDGFQGLKARLEEQQELLAANAKKLKGKWVPKEYQKGTFQEKADVIRKHVRKVLDEYLRENCRPLFDHLNDRNTLIYGVKNRYQPKPRVEWVVELKGGKTGM